jgi:hypothetical protein
MLQEGRYWQTPANEVNVSLAALRYYIVEKQWFPLGQIRSINMPEGINILYANSYPLFAFFAKIMYQFFGVTLNSIYGWSIAATLLQGVSFAFLVVALNVRRSSIIILSAIIGMIMPSYIWRLQYTLALPHFLIIFSLAYYFITARQDQTLPVVRQALILFAATIAIAYLLNVYITAMMIPIFVVTIMAAYFRKKISFLYGAKLLFFTAMALAIISYAFGYFYGQKINTAVGGFDFFSMNLVAPFDVGQGSLLKWVFPNLTPSDANIGQFSEGMQYFGVGWIVLILFAALINGRNTIKSIRFHSLFMMIIVGLALYSLSNKIYFRNTLLLHFSVPHVLTGLTETFRCPGRFFWPLAYLLIAAAVATIAKKMPKSAPFILCFAIVLQLADTHDLRHALRNNFNGLNAEGKPDGKWLPIYDVGGGGVPSTIMNELLKNHKSLKQYPSWWCGGVGNQSFEIETSYIASKYLVLQNSYYTARANKDCYAEDREVRHLSTFDPDTLYIFGQRYADLSRLHSQGLDLSACRILGSFNASNGIDIADANNKPIICSVKFKSNQTNLIASTPQGWDHGGLFPIDVTNFSDMPVVRDITASSRFQKDLYLPENLIGNRTGESDVRFPEYWLGSSQAVNDWIHINLDGYYQLSAVKLLNTNNNGFGDRAAGLATLELFTKKGIVLVNAVKVEHYPQWTTIRINPPASVNAVRIVVSRGEKNGTGLNKIRLVGTKE